MSVGGRILTWKACGRPRPSLHPNMRSRGLDVNVSGRRVECYLAKSKDRSQRLMPSDVMADLVQHGGSQMI